MKADVAPLLPPGTRVVALPSARAPRLYLTDGTMRQRWRHSAFYPAFRWTARLHARAVRVRAALGLAEGLDHPGARWPLAEFLEDCLPGVDASVVAVGTSGPARKLTVQVWRGDAVVGYVKIATTPTAQARLAQEADVVAALPDGLGPTILKHAAFADGRAFVTAAVPGRAVPTQLPMHASVRGYLDRLQRPRSWTLDRHPWVARMRERLGEPVERALEPLADGVWPEAIQHGDFAPWNLLSSGPGRLMAVDWEYGDLRGFPHLDTAYFHLQVAALLRRWAPARARGNAIRHLEPGLTLAQRDALVRLAALQAHHEAAVDGHPADADLQAWRRAVWAER